MTILDDLEPLAIQWREQKIPILKREKAEWLLSFIASHKSKLLRVLEIGTAVGYSGTILTSSGASLITIDSDEKAQTTAQDTFAQFNVDAQLICEDATDALKDIAQLCLIPGDFDLIFIDHQKSKYLEALEWCMKLSKPGTIILADNVTDPKCKNFVAAIQSDARLTTQIIDILDGMSVSIVK